MGKKGKRYQTTKLYDFRNFAEKAAWAAEVADVVHWLGNSWTDCKNDDPEAWSCVAGYLDILERLVKHG